MERSETVAAYSAATHVEMCRVRREARRITLRAQLRVGNRSAKKKREAHDALQFFALLDGATHSPRFVIPAKAGIRASLRTDIG